jgi:TolA-binding protein
MTDKILPMLIGLLIALGGWSLSRTFELSTIQAVHEDKVDKLERQVDKLTVKMDDLKDKEKEIMEQHKKLFEALEDNQPTTGYNYN